MAQIVLEVIAIGTLSAVSAECADQVDAPTLSYSLKTQNPNGALD